MALFNDKDEFYRDGVVGDWMFLADDTHICLKLQTMPDHAGGSFVTLPIKPTPGKPHWEWDGNREAPTLSPSIGVLGNGIDKPFTWHGYLRAGKLVLA